MERIGIIGAGAVGGVLAKRFVELGHGVKVANSRGPASLAAFASRTGAQAVSLADVCKDVDVLITAVPFGRIRDLVPVLAELDRHSILIDAGNYIPQRDGAIADIDAGMAETAWVSRLLGRPVFKVFNSITTFSLEHRCRPQSEKSRIALPIAGEEGRDRAVVSSLVERLGFHAFDAGPLPESWRQQPGQPAYATDPTLKELPPLLARADPKKGPASRDAGMKLMARIPSFPQPELVRILRFSAGLDRLNVRNLISVLGLAMRLAVSKQGKISS